MLTANYDDVKKLLRKAVGGNPHRETTRILYLDPSPTDLTEYTGAAEDKFARDQIRAGNFSAISLRYLARHHTLFTKADSAISNEDLVCRLQQDHWCPFIDVSEYLKVLHFDHVSMTVGDLIERNYLHHVEVFVLSRTGIVSLGQIRRNAPND